MAGGASSLCRSRVASLAALKLRRTPVESGTVAASIRSRLFGFEANLRSNLWCATLCASTMDLIGGYRHLVAPPPPLDETLGVSENPCWARTFPPTPGLFPFTSNDNFHGPQQLSMAARSGFDAETRRGRWYLDLKAKVAFGDMTERADISGATVSTACGTNGQRRSG